jgi:hypothetical protein
LELGEYRISVIVSIDSISGLVLVALTAAEEGRFVGSTSLSENANPPGSCGAGIGCALLFRVFTVDD